MTEGNNTIVPQETVVTGSSPALALRVIFSRVVPFFDRLVKSS